MKYLVTGATGGLGRNLVERLCNDGHQVVALGRNMDVGAALTRIGADFHAIDLLDAHALAQIMTGAEAVFHCAALSSPWGQYKDFYTANVIVTDTIISAMTRAGISTLVHVSTPSLYFDFHDRLDIRENDPLPQKFANHYAATKKLAEDCVTRAVARGNIKAAIIRPRAIIGPYDRNILPRLMRMAKHGWLPLINGGQALVDVTYVDNIVDAMLLAAKSPAGIYNITNGEPILLRDLVTATFTALHTKVVYKNIPYAVARPIASGMEIICRCLPSIPEPPLTRYSAGAFTFSQTLNIDAAKNHLGYYARVPLASGIQKAAAWWRDHEDRL